MRSLLGCGVALLVLTGAGLYAQHLDSVSAFVAVALAQGGAYLAALWFLWGARPSRYAVITILLVAAAMRLIVLWAPPYLSSDVYRYVWDGRVIAAGINPYRYIPTDPHLASLRDEAVFPRINRNNYARTIYPPAAEGLFFAVTRIDDSVTAMRVTMVVCETVAVVLLLLAGMPAARLAVYAWHPLPVWEFAGSGHVDAAVVALIALAIFASSAASSRRSWLGVFAITAGTLVKFYPAALLPALWGRDWRAVVLFLGIVVLAYVPVLGAGWHVLGFLPQYVQEEGFTEGGAGFYWWSAATSVLPLGGVSELAYIGAAAALGAALALYIAFGRVDPVRGTALLAGAATLLASPHYPWYFAWLVVFDALLPSAALIWLTLASFLLYLAPVGSQLVWDRRRFVVESVIYLPAAALAAYDWWRQRHGRETKHGG